jgi:hypothetical protein
MISFMKKLHITRSSPDHDELVELYKKERDSNLKECYQALFLVHEFGNCTMVAKSVKRSRKIIQNWVNAFNDGGLDEVVPNLPPRCPPRLNDEQKATLRKDVLTPPESWVMILAIGKERAWCFT